MERVTFLLALPVVGVSINNLGPADADHKVAFAMRTLSPAAIRET